MFTTTTLHHTMTSTDALTFKALALQLSLLSLVGTIEPDFFDAFEFPALLHWIPALLVVGGRIHHRISLPHGHRSQPTTVGGVRAITAIAAVAILAASAAVTIATPGPAPLELAPASAAFAHDAITT